MEELSESQRFVFNSIYAEQNGQISIHPALPVVRILLNTSRTTELNKMFTLEVIYSHSRGDSHTILYSFFDSLKMKVLIPQKDNDTIDCLCDTISFKYHESEIPTENKNEELVYYIQAFELDEGARAAFEQK